MVVPADQSTRSLTARWRTPDEMELDQVGTCSSCCDGSDSQVAQDTLPRPPGSTMDATGAGCTSEMEGLGCGMGAHSAFLGDTM